MTTCVAPRAGARPERKPFMPARKRSYTRYDPAFKIKAVARFNATPTRKRTALAQRLGVTYQHLYQWAKRAEQGGVEALYGRSKAGAAGKKAADREQLGELSKQQEKLLNELAETCEELRKLRENYAEREAMVLSHISRLTRSLSKVIAPA